MYISIIKTHNCNAGTVLSCSYVVNRSQAKDILLLGKYQTKIPFNS